MKKDKMPVPSEKALTSQICTYIRLQYPEVYFFTDPSGMFQKGWGAKKQLHDNRSTHAQLDVIILEPRGWYHGLVVELKREGERLYKKDNTPVTPHVGDQMESVNHLLRKGYFADFAIGFYQAKEVIDRYLKIM